MNKARVFDLPGRAFVLGRFPPINVNLPLIILGGGRAIVDGRAMHSIQYMHQSLDGLWQELSTRFVKASTPPLRPASEHELAEIVYALRERVERPIDALYRLVGVGLAGFVEADRYVAQYELFE